MNVDEAWESFIKSHQIKKSSIDEKLDMIASQMNELQTDVSRLAENIPEMQGDAAAMEAANAAAGPDMGAPPGLEQLGAMLGGEDGAPMEEDAPMEEGAEGEEAPMEEGAPMEDIAPEENIPVESAPEESVPLDTGASGIDGISGEELDALLSEEDVGVPEADNFNSEMIMKIKDLIMNEDDARKLSILSELLTLVANSDDASSMENMEGDMGPMDDVAPIADGDIGTEPLGKSDSFKKTDDTVNTPTEAVDANEDATDKNLDDGPEPLTTASSPTESVAKAHDTSELMAKIMEAIMPIIKELTDEFTGNDEDADGGEPSIVMSAEVDELPLDEESADAPIDKEPVADDASSEKESDDEEEDDTEDKAEEDGEESESEDDEDDDSEDDDPEDDISEDTEHFEESETVTKSFKDLFAERMATRVGVDGVFAKTPNYGCQTAHMKDGFRPASYEPVYGSADEDAGGKHIMTYNEMASILKSDRPGSSVSVNGELERPDPLTFKKSSAPSVSFRELMNSSNPHDLMKKDWDEYNIFKSQY